MKKRHAPKRQQGRYGLATEPMRVVDQIEYMYGNDIWDLLSVCDLPLLDPERVSGLQRKISFLE